ncbi:MAG: phage terminase large subunit family protein [Steroidobacteraceae bacterium]
MNSPVNFLHLLPEWLTTQAWVESARQFCRELAGRALAPEPELTVSQWADRNRRLSSKASAEFGQWHTSRTPYLREIMDAMTPSHPCTDGDFVKGTQIGGSEAIYNAIGYTADQVPAPVMLVMPTTDTGKKISRQRLQPMIEETPALQTKFSEAKSRSSSNTVLMKDFPGGLLVVAGANSGPGLRSMPMRFVYQDEIDAYPDDVDGEGDPVAVADKRTDQFSRAKRFKCSTPKIKGKSRITRRYEAGSQARYYVPCPHCRHLQYLRWTQMRWAMVRRRELLCGECGGISEIDIGATAPQTCTHCKARVELTQETTRELDTDEVDRAWYECEACGHEIDEHHKSWMMEEWPAGLARHVHQQPGPGQVLADDDPDPHAIWAMVRGELKRFRPRYTRALSWHVPALYSPLGWFSWAKAVKQYLESKKGGYDEESGESLEQVFYNTVLGEAYEVPGEQPKVNLIKQRCEPYALATVPAGGLFLAAGVDVQSDRLEVEVDAFGEGEECWLVDHQVIHGDPAKHGPDSVWAALADYRGKAFPHAGGQTLRILAMAVDSGYATQDVYDFCRTYAHRHVLATKGDDGQAGKPVLSRPSWQDVNHRGQKLKRGVQLWHVGTDTSKERLYRRLDLTVPGPGYQHFPRGLPDEYFEQLTSEKLIRKRVRGLEKREWVKTRERNEALDLKILCYAAAIYAGLQRVNWQQLRQTINPEQKDLFAAPAAPGLSTVASPEAAGGEPRPAPLAPARETARAEPALAPASGWLDRRDNWLQR